MAKRQELVAVISADDRKFQATMKRVSRYAVRAGKILAAATGAGAAFSIREAVKFEKLMAEVNTIAGLGAKEFAGLKAQVRGVMVELGLTAEDAVKGLYDALSAGVPANNAIDFLRVAGRSAKAGVTTLAVAVDGLTSVMNAYGVKAEDATRVSDLMFQVVKDGKITYEQLAQNISKVAPIAKVAGVSLENLSAYVAAMVKVEKPERAMTGLASAIRYAAKSGIPFAEMLKKFEGKNLEQILGAGVGEEAAKGIAILAGNMPALTQELTNMAGAAGATDRAFKIMAETSAQKLSVMSAQIHDMAIGVGETLLPAVARLVDVVSQWMANRDTMENMTTIMGATAEVLALIVEGMGAFFRYLGMVGRGWEHVLSVMQRVLEVRQKLINVMSLGTLGNETAAQQTRRVAGASISDTDVMAARIARSRGFTQDTMSPMAFQAILQAILLELRGEGKTVGFGGMPKPA